MNVSCCVSQGIAALDHREVNMHPRLRSLDFSFTKSSMSLGKCLQLSEVYFTHTEDIINIYMNMKILG